MKGRLPSQNPIAGVFGPFLDFAQLTSLICPVNRYLKIKADPDLTQDIAYIYELLHSNHFNILSNATEYETTVLGH